MKPALLKKIATALDTRGLKRLEPEFWIQETGPNVQLLVGLRSRRDARGFWLEFGLGVRFDDIEQVLAQTMGIDLVTQNGMLGADLRHLVDRTTASGWAFASEADFETHGFDTLMETFDLGLSKMKEYTDRARLRLLIDNATSGIFEDPVMCRFHHYAPIVLYLDGEIALAGEFLCKKLQEAKEEAGAKGSPFVESYTAFSNALLARMAH